MKKFLSLFLVLSISQLVAAQSIDRYAMGPVNKFVHEIGEAKDVPIKQIIDTFRSRKYTEHEMVYAIYTWIGVNLEYDGRAQRHPAHFKETASAAYTERYASSEGYANLFKAMCDVAKIPCIIVHGIAKAHPYYIGKLSTKLNDHYWNMVFIDNTWYNIDASWASGTMDRKMKVFSKDFTDAWYYTNATLFQLSHYTNERKVKLAPTGITKSIFTNAPIIYSAAVSFDIYPPLEMKGKLKGKEKTITSLSFKLSRPDIVKNVTIQYGEDKLIPTYSVKEQSLNIDVPLIRTKQKELTILVNGKEVFGFKTEIKKVKEPKKKTKNSDKDKKKKKENK